MDYIRWLEAFLYGGPEPDMPEWAMDSMFIPMQRDRHPESGPRSDLETKAGSEVWYIIKYDPIKQEVYREFADEKKV